MLQIRMLAGCAIAMLALCALGPAQSSALLGVPEVGRCVKVAPGSGEYVVASCVGGRKAAGGEYDWQMGTKTKFTSSGGLTVLETTGAKKIECAAFAGEGEYYKPFPQDETIHVKLFGCKEPALKVECHNSAPGEIDLVMFGEYGFIKNFINKAGKLIVSVGMSLELSDPQTFECGPNKNQYHLEGGGIGPVTPIDKMSTTFKFKFKAAVGKQKPARFEGGPKHAFTLEQTFPPMPPEEAGLTSTYANTNEEPLEVKAKE